MFQMLTVIVAVVSLVLCFFAHPAWAWLPIALVDLFICVQFWLAKQRYRFSYIPNLSPAANELLRRYGHYFATPFASKDFSASAATSQFAGIIIAVVGAFRTFWWGIAFGAANWFVMGAIAVSLSPVRILADKPALQLAYNEVTEYIKSEGQRTDRRT